MKAPTIDTFIGPTATEFTDREYAEISAAELPIWERPKALKVLAKESDSFLRLGAGLLAWLMVVIGGFGLAVAVAGGAPLWLRAIGIIAAVPLIAGGVLLGHRVWRAGKRVFDAYCWWMLLPESMSQGGAGVEGWRAAPVRDAIQARVFLFEGWRFAKIVVATFAFMCPILFLASLDDGAQMDWYAGQTLSLTVFAVALIFASFCAGIAMFGGVFRANRAHSERDPVQRKLLRRDR